MKHFCPDFCHSSLWLTVYPTVQSSNPIY